MSLVIRPTEIKDLDRVMDIYARAKRLMNETGNPTQWINYPTRGLIESDIEKGASFCVTEDGAIRGVFALFAGEDPTYRVIEGAWPDNEPYVTIHRIAASGEAKGVTRAALEYALSTGMRVRIDTHENNSIMRHVVEKLGFVYCGIIYQPDGSPRLAFQYPEGKRPE